MKVARVFLLIFCASLLMDIGQSLRIKRQDEGGDAPPDDTPKQEGSKDAEPVVTTTSTEGTPSAPEPGKDTSASSTTKGPQEFQVEDLTSTIPKTGKAPQEFQVEDLTSTIPKTGKAPQEFQVEDLTSTWPIVRDHKPTAEEMLGPAYPDEPTMHSSDEENMPGQGMHGPGGMDHGMQQPGMGHGMQQPGMDYGMQQPGMGHGMQQPGMGHGMQQPGMGHGMQQPGGMGPQGKSISAKPSKHFNNFTLSLLQALQIWDLDLTSVFQRVK
jgi:hypothetical protein